MERLLQHRTARKKSPSGSELRARIPARWVSVICRLQPLPLLKRDNWYKADLLFGAHEKGAHARAQHGRDGPPKDMRTASYPRRYCSLRILIFRSHPSYESLRASKRGNFILEQTAYLFRYPECPGFRILLLYDVHSLCRQRRLRSFGIDHAVVVYNGRTHFLGRTINAFNFKMMLPQELSLAKCAANPRDIGRWKTDGDKIVHDIPDCNRKLGCSGDQFRLHELLKSYGAYQITRPALHSPTSTKTV